MNKAVKSKRRYNSVRRDKQAAETRQEILDAAQRLFERDGYAATTMGAIAIEAGASLKTVYLAFETKAGILRAQWNNLLRGEDVEAPIADQPWYREVMHEPDPERQIRLTARNSRAAKLRIAAPLNVIRNAASSDPDIAELWARIQSDFYANQRAIVASIDKKQALKSELDIDRATDILWTINHPNLWQLLVDERSWTPEQYEQWCGDTACTQLLKQDIGKKASRSPRK
jgi:AcrR family transcriptional regulator